MSSIVARATRAAVAVTVVVLVGVGLGTGAILHAEAVAARDEALLAALSAGPSAEEIDGAELTYRVVPADLVRGLPDAWVASARETEAVVRGDLGASRVILGAVDTESDEETDHAHEILVAIGPRVTLTHSVGPFSIAWLGMTALGSALAAALQRWQMGRAVAPLATAVERLGAAARHGTRLPLEAGGPDEVRALLVALNALLARLDAAFAAQTRFTAEAAHELRTPITTLVGEVEVSLRRPRSAEELRETVVRVGDAARRLSALVEGLLVLARVDTGLAEDVREERVLEDLVRAALAQEQAGLDAAGVVFDAPLAGRHVVRVHPPLVVAAIATVLRNVARYAPGRPAALHVWSEGALVRVDVEDGGPGVPAEERETVFDRFTRGASARRQAPDGLGLGLALARAVARAHGGECLLVPSALGGCGVSVRLPGMDGSSG